MSFHPCPIQRSVRTSPHAPAFSFGGRRWTYRELHGEVARVERELVGLGVRAGDRVAVLSRNRPEVVFLIHALARTGAVLAPLNVRLTPTELGRLIERLDPKITLGEAELMERLPFDTAAHSAFPGWNHGLGLPKRALPPCEEGVRAILFTSGTTGVPKGAQLTFENFLASARASAENLGGDPEQVWLGCLPLFHIGGLALVIRCAEYGASFVLQEGFEPQAVAQSLTNQGVTHASLVPTGLRRLLGTHPGNFPSAVRAVLIGGGPVGADLLGEAKSRGLPCLQTYGLTEACSQVATERIFAANGQSAGLPLSGTEVRVVGPTGEELPLGETGEIAVRGPTVMRGYLDDLESTRRALRGGWLYTGDLGRKDAEGRLMVVSRRIDLIVTGGENVYPAEVEAVLTQHPLVEEAAVSWAEDPEWGQRVVALLVPHGGSQNDGSKNAGSRQISTQLQEVAAFCRERLAGFKVPRQLMWVDSLPKNATGKVDRILVRNLLQKLL